MSVTRGTGSQMNPTGAPGVGGGAVSSGTAPASAVYALMAAALIALPGFFFCRLVCVPVVVRSALLISLLERPG